MDVNNSENFARQACLDRHSNNIRDADAMRYVGWSPFNSGTRGIENKPCFQTQASILFLKKSLNNLAVTWRTADQLLCLTIALFLYLVNLRTITLRKQVIFTGATTYQTTILILRRKCTIKPSI